MGRHSKHTYPSMTCTYCAKVEVDGGFYSFLKDEEGRRLWFCCHLCNNMFRHEERISLMPQALYHEYYDRYYKKKEKDASDERAERDERYERDALAERY